MNLSEQLFRDDPRNQYAQRYNASKGDAFHVEQPERSSWSLVLIGLLAVVVGLGVLGVMR